MRGLKLPMLAKIRPFRLSIFEEKFTPERKKLPMNALHKRLIFLLHVSGWNANLATVGGLFIATAVRIGRRVCKPSGGGRTLTEASQGAILDAAFVIRLLS